MGLWDTFAVTKIFRSPSKKDHLEQIRDDTGVPFNAMLFFDDNRRACADARALGVPTVHLSQEDGFCGKALEEGLKLFRQQGKSRGLMQSWLRSTG